ncbi:hypothetical protein G5714_012146 [Onychostoma macrolepis]|uniref:Uncharacterized protein n=1 Tax=Onychostoma macrolepis TaxID=369639 RepID=A0A7J6CPP7_9TELE|nr:hypothetical protein G5714_012146 [Onychostoma macrolepis]
MGSCVSPVRQEGKIRMYPPVNPPTPKEITLQASEVTHVAPSQHLVRCLGNCRSDTAGVTLEKTSTLERRTFSRRLSQWGHVDRPLSAAYT